MLIFPPVTLHRWAIKNLVSMIEFLMLIGLRQGKSPDLLPLINIYIKMFLTKVFGSNEKISRSIQKRHLNDNVLYTSWTNFILLPLPSVLT